MSLLEGISSEDLIKAFTKEPYIKCPLCDAEAAAGTCVIARRSFSRRCFKCGGNSDGGSLPDLDKKVIYLDQCALGFMLRSLMYKEGKTKEDPSQVPIIENFLKAFERLDVLNKKQLLLCPRSDFHFKETNLMPEKRAEALKKVGTLLSSTDSFFDAKHIIVKQLFCHFSTWLKGENYKFKDSKLEAVTSQIDDWKMWINVVVKSKITPEHVQSLLEEKKGNHAELSLLFTKWRTDSDKNYEYFRSLELSSIGSFMTTLPTLQRYSLPVATSMIELLLKAVMYPDELHGIAANFHNICGKLNVPEDEQKERIETYFSSGAVLEVPFFQISSALTALVAHKASQNKEMKVDGNDIIDILFMSLYLPYADAVLMEKTWHRDVEALPLTYKAKVFSVSNFPDFLDYLEKVEASAPPEVIEKVAEVYGEVKPYYTVHNLQEA